MILVVVDNIVEREFIDFTIQIVNSCDVGSFEFIFLLMLFLLLDLLVLLLNILRFFTLFDLLWFLFLFVTNTWG